MKRRPRYLILLALLLTVPLLGAVAVRLSTRAVREVAAFTAVEVVNSAHVLFKQGSPQRVEVEGQPDDLAHLSTTVSGGKLRIGTSKRKPNYVMLSGQGLRKFFITRGYEFQAPVTVYLTAASISLPPGWRLAKTAGADDYLVMEKKPD